MRDRERIETKRVINKLTGEDWWYVFFLWVMQSVYIQKEGNLWFSYI